jgi:hypothetical protein
LRIGIWPADDAELVVSVRGGGAVASNCTTASVNPTKDLGSVLNADALAENGMRSHPSVDETSIVPDLVSITLDGLHNVQIVAAADAIQHDIADRKHRRIYWGNRAKLARLNSATHRASARAE